MRTVWITPSLQAMERQMIVKSDNGLTYFAEMKGSRLDHKMDHLACFIGIAQ
jgi:hypothetical protein